MKKEIHTKTQKMTAIDALKKSIELCTGGSIRTDAESIVSMARFILDYEPSN
jgi:hypothetical protein